MLDGKRRFSALVLLAVLILLPVGFRQSILPGELWARADSRAANAVSSGETTKEGNISRLLKRVNLFCGNATTLADGSRDYHFILMLVGNAIGLLAVIFIFFGGSIINLFKTWKRGIFGLLYNIRSALIKVTPYSRNTSEYK